MAKRKQASAPKRKTEILTLTLPRPVWEYIAEAARLGGLTPDQVVTAILCVRLVTMPKVRP